MKKLTTKSKRILAAMGGAAIVLALLLAVDAITGDPLSRALARRSAVAFAEKLYPGQTFAPDGETVCGQLFCYDTRVQSEQSPDTCFQVRTKAWFFTGDAGLGGDWPSHIFYVEQKRNTCWRLEREADEQLAELVRAQYPGSLPELGKNDKYLFDIMLCCEAPEDGGMGFPICTQDIDKWGGALELDEPFTPEVLRRTPALLSVDYPWPQGTPTAQDKQQALQQVKAFLDANGWHIAYYRINFCHQSEDDDLWVKFDATDDTPADAVNTMPGQAQTALNAGD